MKFFLLASLLVPAVAAAQPVDGGDPLRLPGFVTLDRFDANSRVGGEVSYLFVDGDSDSTALRFDLHGHYVDPGSGFGGYANLPITRLSGNDDSSTAIGDLELGGLYTKQLSREAGIVVRAGLALPTADDEDVFQNVIVGYSRFADLVDMFPSTTLRLSASPVFRSGNVFGRVDLGVDIVLDGDDGNVDSLVRLQPGIGVMLGDVALMGELSLLRGDGETSTNVAVAARFNAGVVEPYVALTLPLDEAISDLVDAMLTVGVDIKI